MTKGDLARLKELRKVLTMDGSSFKDMSHFKVLRTWGPEKEPVSVQEATRVWRDSWVLPVLDEIIAKYERQQELAQETAAKRKRWP